MAKKVVRKAPAKRILEGPRATCDKCAKPTVFTRISFLQVPGRTTIPEQRLRELMHAVKAHTFVPETPVGGQRSGAPITYCVSCYGGKARDKFQMARRKPQVYLIDRLAGVEGPFCRGCMLARRESDVTVDSELLWQFACTDMNYAVLLDPSVKGPSKDPSGIVAQDIPVDCLF